MRINYLVLVSSFMALHISPEMGVAQQVASIESSVREVEIRGDHLLLLIDRNSKLDSLKIPIRALLSFPGISESRAVVEVQSDTLKRSVVFNYESDIDGEFYHVEIEERGMATFTRGDSVDLKIPIDVLGIADFANDRHFPRDESPTAGFKFDLEEKSIGVLLEHTVSFLLVGFALILLATGLVARFVWHARREKKEMLASRKRLFEARENERSEVASELHDGPIQTLQILQGNQDVEDEELRMEVMKAKLAAKDVTRQLREICANLKPPVLHHFGFVRAAKSLTSNFRRQHIEVEVHLSLEVSKEEISPENGLLLYKVLTESLTNIGKHAGAKNVWVDLTSTSSTIRLEIKDDGSGFAVPKKISEFERQGHLGLSFLSQRVESTTSKLKIESSTGAGTIIQLLIDKYEPKSRRRPLTHLFKA